MKNSDLRNILTQKFLNIILFLFLSLPRRNSNALLLAIIRNTFYRLSYSHYLAFSVNMLHPCASFIVFNILFMDFRFIYATFAQYYQMWANSISGYVRYSP